MSRVLILVDNFDFTRKIEENSIFEEKIRQNTTVLYCLAVDNFDFTRKIVKNWFLSFERIFTNKSFGKKSYASF